MERWSFHSPDADATRALGAALGRSIGSRGLVIALVGPLGAGKTVFVKGLAEGLGVDPRIISSPTFVIAQQYAVPQGPETLHHVDLYRLESARELETLGFDDMLGPGQVVAVEWADRFPEALGSERLEIEFEGPSAEEETAAREGTPWRGRKARVTAHGENARQVLGDWADRAAPTPARGRAAVASPEMRALALLLFAAGAFLGGRWLDLEPAARPCAHAVELEADALGSLRVACAPDEAVGGPPLRGIALLLDGRTIDPNVASIGLLERLPGIGPVRARAIVEARRAAPFASLHALERVPGIGPRTRASLEPWLAVPRISTSGESG
jgi:tRNA threonylcarbamoyladenosine biosynthesis protein TsaE